MRKQNGSQVNNHKKNGWENSTIDGFPESAIAWAEDENFGETVNQR